MKSYIWKQRECTPEIINEYMVSKVLKSGLLFENIFTKKLIYNFS